MGRMESDGNIQMKIHFDKWLLFCFGSSFGSALLPFSVFLFFFFLLLSFVLLVLYIPSFFFNHRFYKGGVEI